MTTETEYVAPEEITKDIAEIKNETEGQDEIKPQGKKRGRKPGSTGKITKASLVLRIPAELEVLYSSKEGRKLAADILELYSQPEAQKRIAALLEEGLTPEDCAKGPLSKFAKVELETTIAELEEKENSPEIEATQSEEVENV